MYYQHRSLCVVDTIASQHRCDNYYDHLIFLINNLFGFLKKNFVINLASHRSKKFRTALDSYWKINKFIIIVVVLFLRKKNFNNKPNRTWHINAINRSTNAAGKVPLLLRFVNVDDVDVDDDDEDVVEVLIELDWRGEFWPWNENSE